MKKIKKEKRKYYRHGTEMKIYFQVSYDIRTKVTFQVLDATKQKGVSTKYSGLSRDISVEGISFVSKRKLEEGDMLLLEVYAPNVEIPVLMDGEVRWSHKITKSLRYKGMFYTGVKVISVNGKSVADSIHYDFEYKVDWSIVLETVFGSFKQMVKRLKANNKDKKKG